MREYRITLVSSRARCAVTDSDECQSEVCDPATSTCVNTPGSYRCQCHSGFEPDPAATDRCRGLIQCSHFVRTIYFEHFVRVRLQIDET